MIQFPNRFAGFFQIVALVAAPLAVAPSAIAGDILLGYYQDNATYGYHPQSSPFITTPGITGNNMTGTLGGNADQATGYDCCDLWSVHFFGEGSAQFDLSLSTQSFGTFDALSFDIFNNDCQDGGPTIAGCTTVTWQISESVNGGQYANIGTAYSGLPALFNNTTLNLSQDYQPGDTFAFRAVNLDQPGIVTGQFLFYNIDLVAPAPEPSTWLMLGTSLFGLAGMAARKRRTSAE